MKWNSENGIHFFRISSDIMPQISNWRIIRDKMDFTALAYDIEQFELAEIGKLARKYNQRLTFHPGFFTVLNTPKHFTLIGVMRELWWHTRFFELCGMDINSTLTLHIGGVYNDKEMAKRKFVENFNNLPNNMKYRIIIENDENSFCTDDLLEISSAIEPYELDVKHDCDKCPSNTMRMRFTRIPICFDIFHYQCYNINRQKQSLQGKYRKQSPIDYLMPLVRKTWENGRRQKMHLSEQNPGSQLGTHSEFLSKIPKEIINLDIDLMLEAKCRDKTLLKLLDKYITKK